MSIEILLSVPNKSLTLVNFKVLWSALGDLYKMERFGSIEPLKNSYNPEKYEAAFGIIESGLIISRKSLLFMVDKRPTGVCEFLLTLEQTAFSSIDFKILLKLIKVIHENFTIVYGRACTLSEFDTKHKIHINMNGIMVSNGYVGGSVWDFADYLPGIYWLNIFGPVLSESLEIRKLKNSRNLKFIDVAEDMTVFCLDTEIDGDIETRLLEEEKIRQELGSEFFFSKDESEMTFRHPEAFRKYLSDLQ